MIRFIEGPFRQVDPITFADMINHPDEYPPFVTTYARLALNLVDHLPGPNMAANHNGHNFTGLEKVDLLTSGEYKIHENESNATINLNYGGSLFDHQAATPFFGTEITTDDSTGFSRFIYDGSKWQQASGGLGILYMNGKEVSKDLYARLVTGASSPLLLFLLAMGKPLWEKPATNPT